MRTIFLLTLLAAAAAAPAAEAAVRGVTGVASSPGEIRFTVEFEPPEWAARTLEGVEYRYLAFASCGERGVPGAPALPGRILEVAVPPSGEVSVDATPRVGGRAPGVRYPPAPSWVEPELEPGRERRGPTRRQFVETRGYAGAATEPAARVLDVSVERGVRIARIEVLPVRWSAADGEATWFRSLDVRVAVDGAPPARSPAARAHEDPMGRASRNRRLVNPGDAERWPEAVYAAAGAGGAIPDLWFDDAPGWVKIHLEANGVYSLDRASLAALGVPVSALDPRTFRMYVGSLESDAGYDTVQSGPGTAIRDRWRSVTQKTGFEAGFGAPPDPGDGRRGMEEIAIWVPGEEDGVFDPADRVVFYGLGPDNFAHRFGTGGNPDDFIFNAYTSQAVFWLSWDVDAPAPPKRMDVRDGASVSGTEITSARTRIHEERNTWYDPSMFLRGYRWEEWFWVQMSSDAGAELKLVALPGLVAGSSVSGRVRFWGANQPFLVAGESLHNVRADLNGELLGVAAWGNSGTQYHPEDLHFEDVAASDPLDFRFEVLDIGSDPDRIDFVHLVWIEVEYERALDAVGGPLEFSLGTEVASNPVVVRGAPAGEAVLLDVTDFRNPARLTGLATSGEGAARTVRFSTGAAGDRVFALSSPAAFLEPEAILDERPATPLRDPGRSLDYVIIAHDSLVEEAERLAQWRRSHLAGITETRPAAVEVVAVSDVYDEFSHGMADPSALRYFLEYAYRFYSGDPLSFCVFFGDHTYDTRDHLDSGVPDLVPSWENNRDNIIWLAFGNVQYVTDDPLARFDGRTDTRTDLYLGRISAANPSEGRDIVDKILRAEQDPPRGPWRSKAILVADDACQGRDPDSFAHMSQTENIDRVLPAAFDREKVYLWEYGEECLYDTKPEAKRALLTAWSEGAWVVNYIGHGADQVLADEHVLDFVDIPLLANEGRLPLFNAFSCSVGKFSRPLSQGLGEALVKAPRSGALHAAVATALTLSGDNAKLNATFFERMFPEGPTDPIPIGVALMDAKNAEGGESLKYVALGDPASRPGVPELPLALTGPPQLLRQTQVRIDLTAGDGGGTGPGMVDLVARDAPEDRRAGVIAYEQPGATLYRGESALAGDTTRVSFVVPRTLRGGDGGRVRAYAWGEDWDGLGTLVPISIGGAVTTPEDQTGPEIVLDLVAPSVQPGQNVPLILEDPSGIDLTQLFEFRGVLVRFEDESGVEQLRFDLTEQFRYEVGSFTRGGASVVVPELPPGSYRIVASAYDNLNNKGEVTAEVELVPPGARGRFRSVAAYPNPLESDTQVQFSLDRPGDVSLKIFSVSGRLVWERNLAAVAGSNFQPWDGRDRVGDPVANGVYLLQLTLRQEDGDDVRHIERLVMYR